MIGAAVIVLVVGAVLILGRPTPQSGPAAIAPYAENLQVGDLKLSAAENFVGGSVSYLDGKIANVGPKVVTAITTRAPKSGSRSSSQDTSSITTSIGSRPFLKLFITACLRAV